MSDLDTRNSKGEKAVAYPVMALLQALTDDGKPSGLAANEAGLLILDEAGLEKALQGVEKELRWIRLILTEAYGSKITAKDV